MTFDRSSSFLVLIIGAVATLLAIAWWWLIFSTVTSNDYLTYASAAICLAGTTDLCSLAQSLCSDQHILGIRWYAPEAFWVGGAILLAGLLMFSRSRGSKSIDLS